MSYDWNEKVGPTFSGLSMGRHLVKITRVTSTNPKTGEPWSEKDTGFQQIAVSYTAVGEGGGQFDEFLSLDGNYVGKCLALMQAIFTAEQLKDISAKGLTPDKLVFAHAQKDYLLGRQLWLILKDGKNPKYPLSSFARYVAPDEDVPF